MTRRITPADIAHAVAISRWDAADTATRGPRPVKAATHRGGSGWRGQVFSAAAVAEHRRLGRAVREAGQR